MEERGVKGRKEASGKRLQERGVRKEASDRGQRNIMGPRGKRRQKEASASARFPPP